MATFDSLSTLPPLRVPLHGDSHSPTSTLDNPATLEVVIAYEDPPAGHRAVRALANVVREITPPMTLCPKLWRFDLLADPRFRDAVDTDADGADLFVISTSSVSEVPVAIARWVNACLARKHGTATAIVALFGPFDAWTITILDEDGFRTASQTLRPTSKTLT